MDSNRTCLFYSFIRICDETHPSSSCSIGISIVENESDSHGVTMELEMQWDGNPKIALDIKTRVGVALPVQVSFRLLLMLYSRLACAQ